MFQFHYGNLFFGGRMTRLPLYYPRGSSSSALRLPSYSDLARKSRRDAVDAEPVIGVECERPGKRQFASAVQSKSRSSRTVDHVPPDPSPPDVDMTMDVVRIKIVIIFSGAASIAAMLVPAASAKAKPRTHPFICRS
ncbi:MAG: hypothetical protein ABIR29_01290 [Chthoniobacterales bacterium]